MRFLKALLPVLVLGVLMLAPVTAEAANATFFGPIFPDGTNGMPDCRCDAEHNTTQPGVQSAPDFKCVLATIQNGINFVISIGVIIFVLIVSYAGFLLMMNPFSAENKTKARTIILNAVIGLLIALSAWLIVDFVMKTLYNPDVQDASGKEWGPWNSILGNGGNMCLLVVEPPAGPAPTPDGGGLTTVPTPTQPTNPTPSTGSPTGCFDCVKVTVPHKSPAENGCDLNGGYMGVQPPNPPINDCYVNRDLHQKLSGGILSGWWVSETWPPTYNHAAPCHANGTCVDVTDTSSGNPDTQQIIDAANKLKSQGLYVVYESSLLTTEQCKEIRNATGNSNQVKLMRIGSQPHFSVYLSDRQRSGLCE